MLHCIKPHHVMRDHYIIAPSCQVHNTNLLSTRSAGLILNFAVRLFVAGTMPQPCLNPSLQYGMLKTKCSERCASVCMVHCFRSLCFHVKEIIFFLFLCHTINSKPSHSILSLAPKRLWALCSDINIVSTDLTHRMSWEKKTKIRALDSSNSKEDALKIVVLTVYLVCF